MRVFLAMATGRLSVQSTGNLFLDSLPLETRSRLLAQLQPVNLPLRACLFSADEQPHYVHFMTSGMASVLTSMQTGDAVEMGLVGAEGFPEKLHLLGSQNGFTECFIQLAATGLRMDFKRFRGLFIQDPALLRAVHQYVQYEALTLAQLGACNRLHEVEERLARWLLMVHDRISESEFPLTQEFMSQMLGARRSSVNLAVGSLQRSGLIESGRGRIKLVDRELLKGVACECYPIVERLYRNIYT
jgi:CRP-like cAMP-binding protein